MFCILFGRFLTTSCCCSIYTLKLKFWLLQIKMDDQIWSLEKYQKIYKIKNCFNSMKNIYNKNITFWIQIYFNWMKSFLIPCKYILLNKNLFWLNKNIFWYQKNYLCNISATTIVKEKFVLKNRNIQYLIQSLPASH